jgi:hypothetical protein
MWVIEKPIGTLAIIATIREIFLFPAKIPC